MAQVPLTGGFYQARSLIANAQRCVNLYPELNQPDAPAPSTHYLTPGLVALSQPTVLGRGRGMYLANNGDLFVAVGPYVYYVSTALVWQLLVTLTTTSGMVSMRDNGLVLCIVDGSTNGFIVDLETKVANQILVSNFFGSTYVNYVDTYLTFTKPGTNQFYITTSNLATSNFNTGTIDSGSLTAAGAGFADGVYTNVSLSGGTGVGATANITVVGGVVTNVQMVNVGDNYTVGDVLSSSFVPAIASAATVTLVDGGSNLQPGSYTGISLTGGTGTGAVVSATVTVSTVPVPGGGPFVTVTLRRVTSVTLTTPGTDYQVGQLLQTVGIPAFGSLTPVQATVQVATVSMGSVTPFAYTVSAVLPTSVVNPLDIAAKTGFADNIVNHIAVHRELWLIGDKTTEVWYNTGAADFTFAPQPGVFIEHGCLAPYSLAVTDLTPFWLANDRDGRALVVQGEGYQAKRVSTHAIENAIQKYERLDDAVGFIYQQGGHLFYVLNFPTGDATWVYDLSTRLWHERTWLDTEGQEHRARPIAYANAYGLDICQDWETGELYTYSLETYTDNGRPVVRRRGFPHIKNEQKRVEYVRFIADISTGDQPNDLIPNAPQVFLRWSDDGGKSWGNPIAESMGATGQFLTCPQWLRLGIARDRVFELFWSEPVPTALNSAYVDLLPAET